MTGNIVAVQNSPACAMSRAGKVRDNPAKERFFLSLKIERVAGKVNRTRS